MTVEHPANAFRLTVGDLRLGEFDLGGVLYHANYFHLYESAREAMLRSSGVPYSEFVAQGYQLPIVESHNRYLKPIRYGDVVEVLSWISELTPKTFVVNYFIHTLTGAPREPVLAHTASTKLVCVQQRDGEFRVSPMPEALTAILSQFA